MMKLIYLMKLNMNLFKKSKLYNKIGKIIYKMIIIITIINKMIIK